MGPDPTELPDYDPPPSTTFWICLAGHYYHYNRGEVFRHYNRGGKPCPDCNQIMYLAYSQDKERTLILNRKAQLEWAEKMAEIASDWYDVTDNLEHQAIIATPPHGLMLVFDAKGIMAWSAHWGRNGIRLCKVRDEDAFVIQMHSPMAFVRVEEFIRAHTPHRRYWFMRNQEGKYVPFSI